MKIQFCWFILFITFLANVAAQEDTSLAEKKLDEVIVFSNKFAERRKNIVQKIDVISAHRIAQLNAQNIGDLLANSGNVFVQKSQQGGSSPVIRGFEASRVLLVIDGIRMNNAIYRSGHLQNLITVDQNMLERVEVLYGPASTLYGSDALGGVVHLRTKMPKLSVNNKTLWTGSAFVRYSSANKERTGHFDVSIGGKKFAWLQSYNYSNFSDLKMGNKYPKEYPDFGRRSEYITTINGIDTILKNPDDRVQLFSGYKQWDIIQKLLFKQSDKISHSVNLQYSNSGNVPRYDRLQDVRNGVLRYAEWYYGPQQRELAAYEMNINPLAFFNELRSVVSYQHVKESRHTREYKRYDQLDNRLENLKVWGLTIDGRKLWTKNELTVGFDGQWNSVQSTAFRQNINTGAITNLDTRYPNGDNNMNYFAVYGQHLLKINGGKIVLNDGLRMQTVSMRSTIADNFFFNFPFSEIKQNNVAVTGNIGFIYMPDDNTRFNTGFSSGFRAPNIDDAAKIFESNTASGQVIVPNPNIKPEYTYNVDAGFSQAIGDIVKLEIIGFYTWLKNAIALAPFQFNGKDSINFNGSNSRVYANQNINQAYLYGFNANASVNVIKQVQLTSAINYTYGRLKPPGKATVPLDHVPPVFGKTSLSYVSDGLNAEVYFLFNGWKRMEDYNPSGEDNAQYSTLEGTPSWSTLNFKSTIKVAKYMSLQVGIENIFDRNYRYFASGFSAPGRNFILAIRSSF
ncbi:MAG: TonB-dependent receptor plug domain-containing protein [Chitinophagaceae bacterium]